MGGNITWHSFKPLAEALQEKYPDTDLLSLSDSRLSEMLGNLSITASLPPLPKETKDIFFAVKVAWTRLIEQDEGYDAHQDDPYV